MIILYFRKRHAARLADLLVRGFESDRTAANRRFCLTVVDPRLQRRFNAADHHDARLVRRLLDGYGLGTCQEGNRLADADDVGRGYPAGRLILTSDCVLDSAGVKLREQLAHGEIGTGRLRLLVFLWELRLFLRFTGRAETRIGAAVRFAQKWIAMPYLLWEFLRTARGWIAALLG